MKLFIDTDHLKNEGLTLEDIGVLTYYLCGGRNIINSTICDKLWNKDFLIKEIDSYSFNPHKLSEFEYLTTKIEKPVFSNEFISKLKEIFPTGKKPGSAQMWRGSTMEIKKKLTTLQNKYDLNYTEEQILDAAKRYVNSFNQDYTYMQILKYFILKKDLNKGEETSQLLSYLENDDQDACVAEVGEII